MYGSLTIGQLHTFRDFKNLSVLWFIRKYMRSGLSFRFVAKNVIQGANGLRQKINSKSLFAFRQSRITCKCTMPDFNLATCSFYFKPPKYYYLVDFPNKYRSPTIASLFWPFTLWRIMRGRLKSYSANVHWLGHNIKTGSVCIQLIIICQNSEKVARNVVQSPIFAQC